ncbi:MAG: cytochrome c biogenesis protein ResB [Gammaproteobacteria bacterium]|nr:cytochrome c biogenesis protein ResB [Gammaproteobacteria bacterium]MCY4337462.1 cytochrome c biogenesis protein ResB [Gammaproteobacteria bacterium]
MPASVRLKSGLRFLGSMNLAVTLLVALALASVIGTILKQNEPYQNYIVKFGPFWHSLFERLGLYDIYSSSWFILILAFLVTSTSICLYRNGPRIIASARRYQEDMQAAQLLNLPDHSRHQTRLDPDETVAKLAGCFRDLGFKVRIKARETGATVAAMKGASNRFGYLFTHCAVVIICIGGFLDSNVPLKFKTLRGELQAETRNLPVSRIPEHSKLPATNTSFRASVSIPEGRAVGAAFVNLGAGYLVQPLPFVILLEDFRVEHYPSGQPKSFESDLVIRHGDKRVEHTIAVNHPLTYEGYTIYQASFGDGGSRLDFTLHDLTAPGTRAHSLRVNEALALEHGGETLNLEAEEFRKFNIFPNEDPAIAKEFRDFGPSISYKLRRPDGRAHEYLNYMYPITLEGREFLLSGVRAVLEEEFRYLHIPAADAGSPDRFLALLDLLQDEARLARIYAERQALLLAGNTLDGNVTATDVANVTLRIVRLFLAGGFATLQQQIDPAMDEAAAAAVNSASMKILRFGLEQAYLTLLADAGLETAELSDRDLQFLNDAIVTLSALHQYGSPYYLQLTDFEHVEASGLQIARAPGAKWVYLGFTLLSIGVFLLFYVPHQRLWARVRPGAAGAEIVLAGTRTRHACDFSRYFKQISRKVAETLTGFAPESGNRKNSL